MCHQVIEKSLKAVYVHVHKSAPPFIHRLEKLADKAGVHNKFTEEQINFMEYLDPFDIQAIYPKYKERLVKMLTEQKCKDMISKTEELAKWIREKLLK